MSDLLVIGAGALGMLVARRWKTLHSSANVTLKFRSDNKARNAELEKEGFKIITKERGEKLVNPLVVWLVKYFTPSNAKAHQSNV